MNEVDYGPLAQLLGTWNGDKGKDVAPDPDGSENNAYYETIIFTEAGEVDNAETQELVSVHYQQRVNRISDDKAIHNQSGYWIWDAAAQIIMHSFAIPRAICVNAGGAYQGETTEDGDIILSVSAGLNNPDWQIIQSPFMQSNALTTDFFQSLTVAEQRLAYTQTTMVEIYGKRFEHTDQNELRRQH